MTDYSEITKRKIQLYFAATYLFDNLKSHPQVVEILSEFEPDTTFLTAIVDDAMKDKWQKVFNEAQRLFSENMTYHEVVGQVSSMEDDPEIVSFICNRWYSVKTCYIENLIESRTNISEGIQWVVISALGVAAVFYFHAPLVSKIVWVAGLFASLIIWLYGLTQKKLAAGLKKVIEEDYSRFGNSI